MIYIVGNSKLGRRVAKEIEGSTVVSRSGGASYTKEWFRKNLRDAEAIVFATGRVSQNEMLLEEEHVKPLKELVSAVDCKVLLASSISVYGKQLDAPATERSELNPDTAYARAKAKQEELLKGRDAAILRLGVLYGEEYSIYMKMLSMIDKGIVPVVGKGDNNIPFTYVGSVAKFFKKALSLRGIFNVAGEGCEQLHALGLAASLLGKKPFYVHIPPSIGKVCDLLGCSFNSEAMLSISSDRRIVSKKARSAGFKDLPIEEGIERLVEAYRREVNG